MRHFSSRHWRECAKCSGSAKDARKLVRRQLYSVFAPCAILLRRSACLQALAMLSLRDAALLVRRHKGPVLEQRRATEAARRNIRGVGR